MEILLKIEALSQYVPKPWLLICGVILFFLGLHIWLLGIKHPHLWSFVATAILTMSVGYYFMSNKIGLVAIIAGISGILAALIHKKTAAFFVAILAGAIFFIVISGTDTGAVVSEKWQTPLPVSLDFYDINEFASLSVSLNTAVINAIWKCCVSAENDIILKASGIFVVVFFVGCLLWRLIASIFLSTLGSCILVSGLAITLFFKPSLPITMFVENHELVGSVLLGILALGFLVQFLVVPIKIKKEESLEEEE